MTNPMPVEESARDRIKAIIKEEYKKCAIDPKHFLKRYCVIKHPIRGRIPFHLYKFQEETLDAFLKYDYNIVLKARQIGLSTLVAGYALWLMLFNRDKAILVIATKQEVAKNLVEKVSIMHENLPVWLRGNLTTDNVLTLAFSNGSSIKAVASSPDAGRSEALSLLIIDEAAFIEKADQIWTSAASTLSTGGRGIILSTPNGMGNFFHKKFLEAKEHPEQMHPIVLDWRVHPERDQAWRDKQTEIQGEVQSRQEHDADFITTGNTVVPGEIIEYYLNTYARDPIAKEGFDQNVWIWEYPQDGREYILSADTSRGDGNDFSAFHIIDTETLVQVAEYRGKVDTKQFGNILVEYATKYNDALLIPENSNIGWSTIQQIIDRGYKNLFYMTNDMQVVDVEHQLYSGKMGSKDLVPGFTTSHKTRPLIISKLDLYMREKSVIIYSRRTLNELFTFIWHNTKAQAADGYNDDLVIALCIGYWVRDTALRFINEKKQFTKASLESTTISRAPIVVNRGNLPKDPYDMDIRGESESMLWLL